MKKRKEKELIQALSEKNGENTSPDEAKETEAVKEKDLSPEQKMEEDIALFHELFPHVKGEDIPAEVWERVEEGESLSASYALYCVQKKAEEDKIQKVNEQNEKKAPPRIHQDAEDSRYFSPEAVKKMTRKEIKENYDAILRSMENWN